MAIWSLFRQATATPAVPEPSSPTREERAHDLLLSVLDSSQQQSLSANGYFDVLGSDGNTYRMGPRQTPALLNSKKRVMQQYCVSLRPEGLCRVQYPPEDLYVALTLMIQLDAARFLSIARPIGMY
jgi:hypothetical protein